MTGAGTGVITCTARLFALKGGSAGWAWSTMALICKNNNREKHVRGEGTGDHMEGLYEYMGVEKRREDNR